MSERPEDFDKFINRELLIKLVEQRPVLWDKNQDCYKDKAAKTMAWREICATFLDDFAQMKPNKQRLFEKCVILRWTRIREAWIKTLNNKRSGSGSYRPYRYDEALTFLKRVVDFRDPRSDNSTDRNENEEKYILLGKSKCGQIEISRKITDDEAEESGEVEKNRNIKKVTGNQKGAHSLSSRKRKHPSTVDQSVMRLMDPLVNRPEQVDPNRHLTFFKSILPSLGVFDDDQTLEFQSGVIKLIQTIKKRVRYGDWPGSSYNGCYQSAPGPARSPSASSSASQSQHSESPLQIEVDPILKEESMSD